MNKQIELYLNQLKTEMAGCDRATIQDALADAQEHLVTALASRMEEEPGRLEEDVLSSIMADYGSPEEIAAEYSQVEFYLKPYLGRQAEPNTRGPLAQFFGIFIDPAAWGSFLYMVIALITGVLYFTWVTTGVALSLSLSLFLFGVPLAVLFLLSLQGFSWLEGRLVEGLLGVRMPRRPIFFSTEAKWFDRLKMYLTDKRTWLTMLYLLVQLPFGVLYIVIWTVMVALSLSLIAVPFAQEFFGLSFFQFGSESYIVPSAYYPLAVLMGIIGLTAFMHVAKWVGRFHGRYAKYMLVRE